MMDEDGFADSAMARAQLFEVIENQIASGTPPETKQTRDRLLAEGHSEDEAMRLIACVLVSELFGVMQEGRKYDEASYIEALHALPRLP